VFPSALCGRVVHTFIPNFSRKILRASLSRSSRLRRGAGRAAGGRAGSSLSSASIRASRVQKYSHLLAPSGVKHAHRSMPARRNAYSLLFAQLASLAASGNE